VKSFGFFVALLATALVFTSWAAAANKGMLEMYTATVDRATIGTLAREGVDIAATKQVAGGVRVDLVLSTRERNRLAARGVRLALKRNEAGLTVQQQAAAQAVGGFVSTSGGRSTSRVGCATSSMRSPRRIPRS
jgi:hypothetical protein